jgi:radical SAM family uncharacterized protein
VTSLPPIASADTHCNTSHHKKRAQALCPEARFSGPYETRTRVSALRGRRPGPLDEWAISSRANSTTKGMPVNGFAAEPYPAIIYLMDIMEIGAETIQNVLDAILPRVQKPGRYTGGELNSIWKHWESVRVRLALAFPEIYDLGMSNLGLMILYDLVNRRPDMLAERVFSPWVDMEREMRLAGIPLFALESKRPVSSFDVLGISLPYEQLYTNVLNMLDLSGIPLQAADRDDDDPLVIAGGHAMFNPEPMAPYFDAVVIGDGEEVLVELLEAVACAKEMAPVSRPAILRRLAAIPGVYVPDMYSVVYGGDGTVASVRPTEADAPSVVRKRMVSRLPAPLTKPVVPFIETTHDRAVIEIARGCTRGCRFCQAGYVMRPVRERSVSEVVSGVGGLLGGVGCGEVVFLSLSVSDYTNINELIQTVTDGHQEADLSLSLPSLRIESSSADFVEAVSAKGRKGSVTFAPEAATDRMRNIINKTISEDQILAATEQIFSRGWHTVKLYFMIGLPEETLSDVQEIAVLARKILQQGRSYHGRRARVNLGISTFIPKPHTPFQWAVMDKVDDIEAKHRLLQKGLTGKGLELRWNSSDESLFEALLSQGDRRLAPVIRRAWELGDKFSGWAEHFDLSRWQQALSQYGLSFEFYTHRPRSTAEVLPWDHIDTGVRREFLVEEYERSLRGEPMHDCRQACVACGILQAFSEERRSVGAGAWLCP